MKDYTLVAPVGVLKHKIGEGRCNVKSSRSSDGNYVITVTDLDEKIQEMYDYHMNLVYQKSDNGEHVYRYNVFDECIYHSTENLEEFADYDKDGKCIYYKCISNGILVDEFYKDEKVREDYEKMEFKNKLCNNTKRAQADKKERNFDFAEAYFNVAKLYADEASLHGLEQTVVYCPRFCLDEFVDLCDEHGLKLEGIKNSHSRYILKWF